MFDEQESLATNMTVVSEEKVQPIFGRAPPARDILIRRQSWRREQMVKNSKVHFMPDPGLGVVP